MLRGKSGTGYDCPDAELTECHQGCSEGQVHACAGLLTAGFRGEAVDVGFLGDQPQSLCDAHSPLACRGLGQLYATGEGRPKSDELAVAAFERACSGGDRVACAYLSYMLREGLGTPKDTSRAFELIARSCQQGLARSPGSRARPDLLLVHCRYWDQGVGCESARRVTAILKGQE